MRQKYRWFFVLLITLCAFLPSALQAQMIGEVYPDYQEITSGAYPEVMEYMNFSSWDVYRYQWQRYVDTGGGGGYWMDMYGEEDRPRYSPGPLTNITNSPITYRFRVMTMGMGATPTNEAVIVVYPAIQFGYLYPSSQSIASGSTPETITHFGSSGITSRQWQRRIDSGSWSDIPGATSATYLPGPLTNVGISSQTYAYRIRLNGATSSYTDQVTITVAPEPPMLSGYIAPSPQTINSGSSVSLNHYGYENISSRQWQQSINGGSWTNISGATGTSYFTGTLTNTGSSNVTYYYRILINGSFYSQTASVTILPVPPPQPGGITPASRTIASSQTPGILSHIGVTSIIISSLQWQQSVNGSAWTDIPDERADTYSPGALFNFGDYYNATYSYRVKINNGAYYSSAANVTVTPTVPGEIDPFWQEIFSGDAPAPMSHAYFGGIITSRKWQRQKDGGAWEDIIPEERGEHYYDPGVLSNETGRDVFYSYRVKLNDGELYSDEAAVRVFPTTQVGYLYPSSQSIASGATPDPITHYNSTGVTSSKWQRRIDLGNWEYISSASGTSYSPPSLINTGPSSQVYSYRVEINTIAATGQAYYTDPVTVTVSPQALMPGEIYPNSATINSGEMIPMLVHSGSGFIDTRQWEYSVDGGEWQEQPDAEEYLLANIRLTNSSGRNQVWYFRVRINGADIFSETAAITVKSSILYGTVTPPSQEILSGQKPETLFHVDTLGIFHRQWQRRTYPGGYWEDISDAFDTTYSPDTLYNTSESPIVYHYRVKLNGLYTTDTWGPPATITVKPLPQNFNSQSVSLSNSENYVAKYVFREAMTALHQPYYLQHVIPTVTYYDGLGRPKQTIQVGASGQSKDIITPIVYDPAGRGDATQYLPYADTVGHGSYRIGDVLAQQHYYDSLFNDTRPFAENIYEASPLNRVMSTKKPGAVYATHPVQLDYGTNIADEVLLLGLAGDNLVKQGSYAVGRLYKNSTTDEDGATSITFTDLQGRKVLERRVGDNQTLDTYYVYDDLGRLRWVISPEGSARMSSVTTLAPSDALARHYCYVYTYDGRRNVISKQLPGAQAETYVYDSGDRMISRTRGTDTWHYAYDALGRPTLEQLGGATTAEYAYDSYPVGALPMQPVGELSLESDQRVKGLKTYERVAILDGNASPNAYVERTFYYDTKGRLVQTAERNHLGGISRTSTQYDFIGNVLKSHESHQSSPTAAADVILTENQYDQRGRLTSSTTSLNGGTPASVEYAYNDLGQLSEKTLGSVVETLSYNVQGWLSNQSSSRFSMELDYFNANKFAGNITRWSWSNGGADQHYSLTYDAFNRLTSGVHSSNNGFNESIGSYDRNGNILSLNRGADNFSYSYTGNQLNALSGVSGSYSYDANGNMTHDPRKGLSFGYNSLNLLQQVKQNGSVKAKYAYASDGTKLQIRDASGSNGYDYLGSLTLVRNNGNSIPEAIFSEGLIRGNEVTYFERDHLGSVRTTVNASGTITGSNDYYPFGLRHPAGLINQNNRYLFNGKEDQVTGALALLDFGARMYDFDRWMTIDPLAEKYYSISPYAYTLNNPVYFVDRDGRQPGVAFISANDAAQNWGHYYNGKSILMGREMGSSIYSETRNNRVVYVYTEPSMGSNAGVTISNAPAGKTRVATIHSHGKYERGYLNNEFSDQDKNNAENRNADNYATTPNGTLKRYDFRTNRESIISIDLPSDPKDPDRKNNIDPVDVPEKREDDARRLINQLKDEESRPMDYPARWF